VSDRPLVVCIGRFSRQKGQDLIVDRWHDRLGRLADLVLVGADSASRPYPSVFIEPYQDPLPWLERASLAVAPSRWEGRSIAILELQAAGIPVVAFDIPSMREILVAGDDEPGGAVAPAFDVEALLQLVEDRLTDQVLLDADSAAAPRRAASATPEAVAAATLRAYETALRSVA
jgi:glycosyltransferase involved in cell wall biosynthesis